MISAMAISPPVTGVSKVLLLGLLFIAVVIIPNVNVEHPKLHLHQKRSIDSPKNLNKSVTFFLIKKKLKYTLRR